MTAKLFAWIYDSYVGILNHVLRSLRLVAAPVDWLGNDATGMAAMIPVGIFVSLPFTTYVVLARLSAIPGEGYEAAGEDGASAWRTCLSVTLPLERPAPAGAVGPDAVSPFH